MLASPAKQPARPERGPVDEVSAYLQQQLKERQWDYDLVSLAADARVTDDGNLVGLQVGAPHLRGRQLGAERRVR